MQEHGDPRWFTLVMASRWPFALAVSAWAVAVAAIQILRQPIPIGLPLDQPFPVQLVGGVTVDELKAAVRVKSEEPLAIEATKTLPVQGQVSVTRPVLVESNKALDVRGKVSVDEVTAPVEVKGIEESPILVGTPDEEQLNVGGAVEVTEVGGRINVRLRDAAKSVLPIP
jgi:hypothetical protein